MFYQVHLALEGFKPTTLVVIRTDWIGSWKFNFHTITTMTAPWITSNWQIQVKWYDGTTDQGWIHGGWIQHKPPPFAPPSALRNFFKCAPPNLKSWIRPCWLLLSYGSWLYNYLGNQCLSPLTLGVLTPLRRGVLDTTLCDLRQVSGFLRLPPTINLTATI